MITTETLVWAFFFAVIVAVVYAFAMQNFLSGLATKLTQTGTDSKDKAKTLEELGYKPFSALLTAYFLSSGTTVARAIVKIGGETNEKADSEMLFREKTPVKYYLPEENITKNVKKHLSEKTSLAKLAALLIILALVAYIASAVINFLGNYAYGLIDGDGGKAPIGVQNGNGTLLEDQEELNRLEEEQKKLEEELAAGEEQSEGQTDGQAENEVQRNGSTDTASQN